MLGSSPGLRRRVGNGGSCERPYKRPSDRRVTFAAADTPPGTEGCQQKPDYRGAPVFCEFGAEHPTRTVALVGSSFAVQFVPTLEAYGEHEAGGSSSRPQRLHGPEHQAVDGQSPDHQCVAWSKAVQDHLLDGRPLDAVVFPRTKVSKSILPARMLPTRRSTRRAIT